jgi:ubiquinone/menaquinone biosynthesis C-methylase UbiE
MEEAKRIEDFYRKKKEKDNPEYSLIFSWEREKAIKEAIRESGITPLSNKKILDIGCGAGAVLSYFLREEVPPENLHGVDLISERIQAAKKLYPGFNFYCTNAQKLPFEGNFFDIIIQSTVFTSILDAGMKKNIALEMIRTLKPDGVIVWHDYRINSPFNHNVRAIAKREIIRLFPGCRFSFKLINLNPVIARPLAKNSIRLYGILEKCPFLMTHWLAAIKKNV